MTFTQYLAARVARYDAEGDFIRLARADSAMPDVETWEELRSHLETKAAWPDMMDVGQRVLIAYQKAVRKARLEQS